MEPQIPKSLPVAAYGYIFPTRSLRHSEESSPETPGIPNKNQSIGHACPKGTYYLGWDTFVLWEADWQTCFSLPFSCPRIVLLELLNTGNAFYKKEDHSLNTQLCRSYRSEQQKPTIGTKRGGRLLHFLASYSNLQAINTSYSFFMFFYFLLRNDLYKVQ